MAPKLAIDIHADGADLTTAIINFSSSGLVAVLPGIAGQIIRVYRLFFIVSAATTLTVQDGANAFSGPMNFAANGSLVLDFDTKPWFVTSIGNAFNFNSTNPVQIGGMIFYTQGN